MNSSENVFLTVNSIAFFCWIFLFVFYEKAWIYKALFSFILVGLALTYAIFITKGFGGETNGGFDTLANLKVLFENDEAVLAGWIHYLVFDLFVGMWICWDSTRRTIGRWWILPCLIFTFMMGPVGLLLYFIIRVSKSGKYMQDPFSTS